MSSLGDFLDLEPEPLNVTTHEISGENATIVFDRTSGLSKVRLAFAIMWIIFVPLITINNLFVITATAMFDHLRIADNVILASLAGADLLVGVFAIPMSVLASIHPIRPFIFQNQRACLTLIAAVNFCLCGSFLHLVLLCVHRFIAVKCPQQYPTVVSYERTLAIIGILWILNIQATFLPVYTFNTYNSSIEAIDERCDIQSVVWQWYLPTVICTMLVVGLSVSLILHSYVLCVVMQQILERRASLSDRTPLSREQRMEIRSRHRTLICTVVMMMSYIVLWLPLAVVVLLTPFQDRPDPLLDSNTMEVIKLASLTACYANSLLNPAVYSLSKADYRRAYDMMLHEKSSRWWTFAYQDIGPRAIIISQPVDTMINIGGVRKNRPRYPSLRRKSSPRSFYPVQQSATGSSIV